MSLRRVCKKHRRPILQSRHGERMYCSAGCENLRGFLLVDENGREVGQVTNCYHRGRAASKPCPVCGELPAGPRRNQRERELADAETSVVEWAPECQPA